MAANSDTFCSLDPEREKTETDMFVHMEAKQGPWCSLVGVLW